MIDRKVYKCIDNLVSKYHPEFKGDNEAYFLLVFIHVSMCLFSLYTIYLLYTEKVHLSTNVEHYIGVLFLFCIFAGVRLKMKGRQIRHKQIKNNYNCEVEVNNLMNWKGQNNVLTDMFREAKNKGYLTNSIPDVALFLKTNFSCFNKTKLSTIEGLLKNNTSSANSIPKEEKRIKIEQ